MTIPVLIFDIFFEKDPDLNVIETAMNNEMVINKNGTKI